jgi:hypothetical protein
MGRGSNRIYNIISLVFLVLALLVLVFVGVRMAQPPVAVATPVAVLPTAVLLPSLTPTPTDTPIPPTATFTVTPSPTNTETFTPSPTFTWTLIPTLTTTPVPPTLTPLPSATWFPSATITPSLTITFTLVPSQTPIPSNTSAPTATINSFTPQPTEPPPSPFPFRLRDPQPVYTLNFANSAGCAWQGIGGQVSDMAGLAINGIRVHVYGSGIDTFSTTGSNSLYGSSGWEVPLANIVSTNVYFVELQSQGGTIISETVRVQFPGNCQQNLALVNFQQTREF